VRFFPYNVEALAGSFAGGLHLLDDQIQELLLGVDAFPVPGGRVAVRIP
jgi:hypothetical protein